MIDNIIYKDIKGLKFCFIPKKDYIEKQAIIAFNYGSAQNTFFKNNKKISFPPGIAHFLEHKMFEDENINIFEEFNKFGGNVNAYTNFSTTAYYFTCVEKFTENFQNLLKLVSSAYFTDENVEKEKGIIAQEIKMYDDDPYWRVYFNLIKLMYGEKNPISNDIAGKVEDINKIDKNMLYDCYNNFYTKDNAIIIICGDIENLEEIEEAILNNLNINDKKDGNLENNIEKYITNKNFVEQKMDIKQKIFNIGFKNVENYDKIEYNIVSNKIFLDIIFGISSKFFENMYNKGIIDNSFGFDYNFIQNNKFYLFFGNSNKYDTLIDYLKKEILYFKKNGLNKDDFNRIKNKHLGIFERQFNSINSIISMEVDFFSKNFTILDYLNALKNIEFQNIQKILENFQLDHFLSVIN